jgi:hypothetical protein
MNWKESMSELSPTYNFKWSTSKKQIEFGLFNNNNNVNIKKRVSFIVLKSYI